ncbi:hypothetical protein YQE_12258, partial [Dendroctonus ponderosae]
METLVVLWWSTVLKWEWFPLDRCCAPSVSPLLMPEFPTSETGSLPTLEYKFAPIATQTSSSYMVILIKDF